MWLWGSLQDCEDLWGQQGKYTCSTQGNCMTSWLCLALGWAWCPGTTCWWLCLGLAQVKKKLNKELISSSSTYVWCQIREECMSCIQRRCSLLTPSTKFDSAIQNQESPWACLYQEPGTVWSRSVQTFSNLAAGTFTGSCSRVNKCQLKEIPCKGAQKRQNWEWCYWNHSSRSISCPRVALTWVLPCLFFSTKFRKTS